MGRQKLQKHNFNFFLTQTVMRSSREKRDGRTEQMLWCNLSFFGLISCRISINKSFSVTAKSSAISHDICSSLKVRNGIWGVQHPVSCPSTLTSTCRWLDSRLHLSSSDDLCEIAYGSVVVDNRRGQEAALSGWFQAPAPQRLHDLSPFSRKIAAPFPASLQRPSPALKSFSSWPMTDGALEWW